MHRSFLKTYNVLGKQKRTKPASYQIGRKNTYFSLLKVLSDLEKTENPLSTFHASN